MKITKLRITGFKSFVDPTEIPIEPGRSGVVGPNGCGKSNLVEAVRWVMGETSPKNMRGSGMDDVIFSGTANRPPRNMAEVTLVIDNGARTAPASFNDSDTLEITRRIEREAGSVYRINGREVRARDVQILFADASTGALSPALVRQGQIAEIISAKPRNRRMLLEEAAGISGLHSRRHEAELRLRAAETNLTRVHDLIQQLEVQLAALRRQARQATRYRNLSGDIRKVEARLLLGRWTGALEAIANAQAELAIAERAVAETTERSAHTATREIEASQALPALREAEARAAAGLHRLTIERDTLDAEAARARSDAERLSRTIGEIELDLAREGERLKDAEAALAGLDADRQALADAGAGAAEALAEAEANTEYCRKTQATCEQALEQATREAAEATAQRHQLARTIEDAQNRLARLGEEHQTVARERAVLEAARRETAEIEAARAALQAVRAAITERQQALEAAEAARAEADRAEAESREPLQKAERAASQLRAEADAIAKLLGGQERDLWPPVVDAITVTPGFEAALGAALGDDLEIPADEAAPAHWRDLGPLENHGTPQQLPPGVRPLTDVVNAPPALRRRLAFIGIVEADAGARLQSLLKPGQRLVSRQGDLWRWDGLTAKAEAPTAAALRLAQRNRLTELDGEVARAEAEAGHARAFAHDRQLAAEGKAEAERAARKALRSADDEANAARERLTEAEKAAAAMDAKLASLHDQEERLSAEIGAEEIRLGDAKAQMQALPESQALQLRLEVDRQAAQAARLAFTEAQTGLDGLRREQNQRETRAAEVTRESQAWRERQGHATRQIATLTTRLDGTRGEHARVTAIPATIEDKRVRLLTALDEAEARRKDAADALGAGEAALKAAAQEARAAAAAQSEARETRARLDAMLTAARQRTDELKDRIHDVLDCAPGDLEALAQLRDSETLPPLEDLERRLERLKRERETLGSVNLRADEEATEIDTQLTTMLTEKSDLEAAIAKLRQGITKLNSEGRERLLGAFDTVNGHFQKLFTLLFSGGHAELKLVESDDPLEAGLEIFARPPGKKLQVMTLLSGGEQTLTALALIFAVFLSNPAPICVLDEVDAPLDDANVERFVNLVDEMTRVTETRFVIITHHPYTMARMDRLFGVTMAERGVSQLVSVDLAQAEQVRAAS